MKEQEESDEVDLGMNLSGEEELCGSSIGDEEEFQEFDQDLQEEESELEDGEVSSATGSDDAEDPEIEKCVKNRNIKKLRAILKTREEDCKKLREEMCKEKEREKQDKEMESILAKISKVNRTRDNLKRSIASSRANSPRDSPKARSTARRRSVVPKSPKGKRGKVSTKRLNTNKPASASEKSEYKELFNSLINLKHGGNHEFAEVVADAMEATDNILTLKSSRNDEPAIKVTGSNTKVGQKEARRDSLFKLIDQLSKQHGKHDSEALDTQTIAKLIEVMGDNNERECEYNSDSQVVKGESRAPDHGKPEKTGQAQRTQSQVNTVHTSEVTTSDGNAIEEKKKKLVSGKCTKPDESDIKMVVKFAHEKLDPRHVQERVFDKLSFNLLVAGELELISLDSMSEIERKARINIAKTLCYHKKYLSDFDLRTGYDNILKQVEQGQLKWSDNLGDALHHHLDYRANVIFRDKMVTDKEKDEGFTKVEPKRRQAVVPDEKIGKVIFCADYNAGTCTHPDNHEGRFSNRKVTKFHICKRCHKEGDYRSHREGDECCPRK